MTQLIGVICEGGSKVILLSDRMVSSSDLTLQFEHEAARKAFFITDKSAALMAGTLHEPELFEDVKKEIQKIKSPSIREIADVFKDKYQSIRESHIVDEILRPRLGLNSLSEYIRQQKMLHDSVLLALERDIKNYSLDLWILLGGIDTTGHLIQIINPGTWRSYDNLGFCCIGTGERHADSHIAYLRYSVNFPENEALYIVFEAKKRAEAAGGVGPTTDIWVIDEEGIYEVTKETIATLEEIYRDREATIRRERFDRRVTELRVSRRKVEIT